MLEKMGKKVEKCQICGSKKLEPILALGHHAPVHAHLWKKNLNEPEVLFPLNLCHCPKCGLKQIDYIVDPKIIFYPEYPYFTSLTNMLVNNFRQLADTVIKKYKITGKDLVIDIGSNDGTLLRGFKDGGTKVLGVEPTNVAKVANKRGIPTIQEFFNSETAGRLVKKYGQAKVITAANVFAHIDNVYDLLAGIKKLLKDDGLFVSESQYFMDTIEKTEFDCIYHEHLRYYSLKPVMYMLKKAGFSLIDAERIGAAGGSIRIYAVKGNKPASARALQLLDKEKKIGLYDTKTLKEFAGKVQVAMRDLLGMLVESLPLKDIDNLTVTLAAVLLGAFFFG